MFLIDIVWSFLSAWWLASSQGFQGSSSFKGMRIFLREVWKWLKTCKTNIPLARESMCLVFKELMPICSCTAGCRVIYRWFWKRECGFGTRCQQVRFSKGSHSWKPWLLGDSFTICAIHGITIYRIHKWTCPYLSTCFIGYCCCWFLNTAVFSTAMFLLS